MKTNFVIAAIAATTLFAACNKDNDRMNPEDTGKATSMKVSVNFPNAPQTRAGTEFTGDPNATINEATINTVDVFVYFSGSGSFSSHTRLDADDFTQMTTGTGDLFDLYKYTATKKIPTTTGAKSVFAGINLPLSVVNALIDQPASALAAAVQTMTRAELAGTSNFAMFSTESVNSTFVEDDTDPANNVTLTCKRMVAKVTVETDEDLQQTGVPGTLDNLKFAVNNFNTKLFMLQGEPDLRKDPNWASSDIFMSSDFTAAVDADYAPILKRKPGVTPSIKTDYTPRYAAENTSEGKLKKEITRVTVQATFIPKEVTVYKNDTDNADGYKTTEAHGVTDPKTFYAVTPSITAGTSYFYDEDIANAFAQDNLPATVLTYTGGLCYWDIFLNKNPLNPVNRWDVLRNDFYMCNITRIVAPGRNTPDVPDPGVTPDVNTNITADIKILFWNTPILSDYVLE